MKVLIVYPYLPHPGVGHGSGRLLAPLLERWSRDVEVTLVCGYRPHEAGHVEATRGLVRNLIAVPRPQRRDLSAVGRAVESARTALMQVMRRDPIHVTKLDRAAFHAAIREARARTRFDVAQVEQAGMSRCVESLAGLPAILVDHEAGVASGGDLLSDPRSLRYIQAIYPRYRCVGTLCREDAAEISAALPGVRVVVRRPGVAVREGVGRGPGAPSGRSVLFVGSEEHAPNRDALAWLATGVWPIIGARVPEARCVVAGGVSSPRLARQLEAAGIRALGFVPDVTSELAAAAVFVAPLRLGRGVRMKNLEALAAGCPLVTTSLGARGLDLEAGEHALIADGAEEIAAAVVTLLRDPKLAARIGAAGQAHVRAAFTHDAASSFNLDLWKELATA
jgi:glycosyltransferase involved in cell wall biosynthesis